MIILTLFIPLLSSQNILVSEFRYCFIVKYCKFLTCPCLTLPWRKHPKKAGATVCNTRVQGQSGDAYTRNPPPHTEEKL
jgi:hypothetical protein